MFIPTVLLRAGTPPSRETEAQLGRLAARGRYLVRSLRQLVVRR